MERVGLEKGLAAVHERLVPTDPKRVPVVVSKLEARVVEHGEHV